MKKAYFLPTACWKKPFLNAIKELGGETTTEQINQKAIEILNLPDEIG